MIGLNRFRVIAHHVLIGNQVIVRCSCKLLVHTIIDCLKVCVLFNCCAYLVKLLFKLHGVLFSVVLILICLLSLAATVYSVVADSFLCGC